MSVDATKPTDDQQIVDWPALIRAIAVVANAAEAAAGGDLSRGVLYSSVDQTITNAWMNKVLLAENAGSITKTLPDASIDMVGNWIRIQKGNIGDLIITPFGSDTIAGSAASITNAEAGESKAAFIELECLSPGKWSIAGMLGTWA